MNHIKITKFISKRKEIIILIITFLILIFIGGHKMTYEDGGVVRNARLKGYNEVIKSKDIIYFEYHGFGNHFICKLDNNKLIITSKGETTEEKTYFNINYEAKNKELLNKLQKIIENNNISKNNGYEYEVAGLPEGLGDNISVKYKTGEKIWKYSNQNTVVGEKAKDEIYNVFYEDAKENNIDFNSYESNKQHDEATIDYLQGTWEGTHFGKTYKVIFEKTNIKIYEDDKLTDDTKYIIIDGNIVKDELKEKVEIPKNRYDYKEFNTISTMSKKNDFTLVAYFLKDSYSTCDLLKK